MKNENPVKKRNINEGKIHLKTSNNKSVHILEYYILYLRRTKKHNRISNNIFKIIISYLFSYCDFCQLLMRRISQDQFTGFLFTKYCLQLFQFTGQPASLASSYLLILQVTAHPCFKVTVKINERFINSRINNK